MGSKKLKSGETGTQFVVVVNAMTHERIAWEIANRVHNGQMYGDLPYMVHIATVAAYFESEVMRVLAILHDVLHECKPAERSEILGSIREKLGEEVFTIIQCLTRKDGQDYMDYIAQVCERPMAWTVKMAELKMHVHFCENVFPERKPLLRRYKAAIAYMRSHHPMGFVYEGDEVFPID